MTDATIEARNGLAGSTLTIDGNLSGSFTSAPTSRAQAPTGWSCWATSPTGSCNELRAQPDRAAAAATVDFTVVSIEGQGEADAPAVAGVTGQFADSVLGAQASFNQATGAMSS